MTVLHIPHASVFIPPAYRPLFCLTGQALER